MRPFPDTAGCSILSAVAGDLTEIVQDRRADLISEGQFEWLPRLALANPDASVPPVNIVQHQGDNVAGAQAICRHQCEDGIVSLSLGRIPVDGLQKGLHR